MVLGYVRFKVATNTVNTNGFSRSSLQEWPQTTLFTVFFLGGWRFRRETHKNRLFLKCLGFKNGRDRLCRKVFFSLSGFWSFQLAKQDGSLESPGLLLIPCYLSFTSSSLKSFGQLWLVLADLGWAKREHSGDRCSAYWCTGLMFRAAVTAVRGVSFKPIHLPSGAYAGWIRLALSGPSAPSRLPPRA